MHIELAEFRDAPQVMLILGLCHQEMLSEGIRQWDALYPGIQDVEGDARARTLFVAREQGVVIGAVTLNDEQPDQYSSLSWRCVSTRALVVHRLCVRPELQHRGIGRQLMDFAEQFAAENGFPCIRLEAYTGNPRALKFYERRGYHKVGQAYFPRRILPFDCLELCGA